MELSPCHGENEVNDSEGGGLLIYLVEWRRRYVDDNTCFFLSSFEGTCDYGCHLDEAYGTST